MSWTLIAPLSEVRKWTELRDQLEVQSPWTEQQPLEHISWLNAYEGIQKKYITLDI